MSALPLRRFRKAVLSVLLSLLRGYDDCLHYPLTGPAIQAVRSLFQSSHIQARDTPSNGQGAPSNRTPPPRGSPTIKDGSSCLSSLSSPEPMSNTKSDLNLRGDHTFSHHLDDLGSGNSSNETDFDVATFLKMSGDAEFAYFLSQFTDQNQTFVMFKAERSTPLLPPSVIALLPFAVTGASTSLSSSTLGALSLPSSLSAIVRANSVSFSLHSSHSQERMALKDIGASPSLLSIPPLNQPLFAVSPSLSSALSLAVATGRISPESALSWVHSGLFRVPDWFDKVLARRRRRAEQRSRIRASESRLDILYKCGNLFSAWQERLFEIGVGAHGLELLCFRVSPQLQELESQYTQLLAQVELTPQDPGSQLRERLHELRSKREALRLASLKGSLKLVEGATQIIVPPYGVGAPTPYVFEVVVGLAPDHLQELETNTNLSSTVRIGHHVLPFTTPSPALLLAVEGSVQLIKEALGNDPENTCVDELQKPSALGHRRVSSNTNNAVGAHDSNHQSGGNSSRLPSLLTNSQVHISPPSMVVPASAAHRWLLCAPDSRSRDRWVRMLTARTKLPAAAYDCKPTSFRSSLAQVPNVSISTSSTARPTTLHSLSPPALGTPSMSKSTYGPISTNPPPSVYPMTSRSSSPLPRHPSSPAYLSPSSTSPHPLPTNPGTQPCPSVPEPSRFGLTLTGNESKLQRRIRILRERLWSRDEAMVLRTLESVRLRVLQEEPLSILTAGPGPQQRIGGEIHGGKPPSNSHHHLPSQQQYISATANSTSDHRPPHQANMIFHVNRQHTFQHPKQSDPSALPREATATQSSSANPSSSQLSLTTNPPLIPASSPGLPATLIQPEFTFPDMSISLTRLPPSPPLQADPHYITARVRAALLETDIGRSTPILRARQMQLAVLSGHQNRTSDNTLTRAPPQTSMINHTSHPGISSSTVSTPSSISSPSLATSLSSRSSSSLPPPPTVTPTLSPSFPQLSTLPPVPSSDAQILGTSAVASLWEMVRAMTAAKAMCWSLPIRDRPRLISLFKAEEHCFAAKEAVSWLLAHRVAVSLEDALRLCGLLVAMDIIRPVSTKTLPVASKLRDRDWEREKLLREAVANPRGRAAAELAQSLSTTQGMNDFIQGESYTFTADATLYRFTSHKTRDSFVSAALRPTPVDWAFALALYQNLDLRDRPVSTWSEDCYPLCFIGSEAVRWLVEVERLAANEEDAIRIMTRLLHLHIIENSTRPEVTKADEVYKSSPSAYYRFNFLINFHDVEGDGDDDTGLWAQGHGTDPSALAPPSSSQPSSISSLSSTSTSSSFSTPPNITSYPSNPAASNVVANMLTRSTAAPLDAMAAMNEVLGRAGFNPYHLPPAPAPTGSHISGSLPHSRQ